MDEYGLVGLERPHNHDKLPGGKVIHWNCSALKCRQSGRSREDLLQRHADHVGISAKAGHRNYVLADPALVDASGDSVDSAADFVARHDGNGRQIGIYAHAPHDIGEIDPARLHADAYLSRVRRRIGGFLNSQYSRRPSAGNPNLSHDTNSQRGHERENARKAYYMCSSADSDQTYPSDQGEPTLQAAWFAGDEQACAPRLLTP